MEGIKNEVALMFSGGIDSLLAAVVLPEKFEKVHLITFDKGYLEFGIKNNLPNIQRLKETYGEDKFLHEIINIKKIFRRISVKTIIKDRKKFETEVVWCVACRLAMNTGALIYALENGLLAFADGSNKEQTPGRDYLAATAENFPSVVDRLKEFAREHAVEFVTPVYEFGSREERRAKLRELGFDIDYLSMDHGKGIKGMMTKDIFSRSQPMCLSGWLIHWKRNLFGKLDRQDEEETLDYVIYKQENIVRDYIKDYFQKKNIDLEDLIQERKNLIKKGFES